MENQTALFWKKKSYETTKHKDFVYFWFAEIDDEWWRYVWINHWRSSHPKLFVQRPTDGAQSHPKTNGHEKLRKSGEQPYASPCHPNISIIPVPNKTGFDS